MRKPPINLVVSFFILIFVLSNYLKHKVMLKPAKELKKEMKVSELYLVRVSEAIDRFKNKGKVEINCGYYSCTEAELQYAIGELTKNGYKHSFGRNSHGVRTLIVTW